MDVSRGSAGRARMGFVWGALMLSALVIAGCGTDGGGGVAAAEENAPVHVDSILSIEEEVRRFRAALPDSVDALTGGGASIEELVAVFLTALEAGDREALAKLAITPAEFAYLYYPETRFTDPPYEMSPGLLWFQLDNYGSRGLSRALDRYGERPLDVVGQVCAEEPVAEGDNRIWSGCVVQQRVGEDTVELSLFGAILERDGRYKFVSYGNTL